MWWTKKSGNYAAILDTLNTLKQSVLGVQGDIDLIKERLGLETTGFPTGPICHMDYSSSSREMSENDLDKVNALRERVKSGAKVKPLSSSRRVA
jgi:hypothetical protein